MQRETHGKVLQLLQAATAERDIAERLRLLHQAQDVLLHADTLPDTVGACLDYFLNLQADPHEALRRFAAYFLERLLPLKPSLVLRCVPAIVGLLRDSDGVAQELAVRCACALHGRALHLLALEEDKLQFQRCFEQLQEVRQIIVELFKRGCPSRPALFRQVTRWVRVAILVQTPSPLLLRIRVPPELRGASCLQDFPVDPGLRLDLDGLRRQAEELVQLLCRLHEEPPQGRWPRSHFASLVRCAGSIGRQRPTLLTPVLDIWQRLLRDSVAALDGLPQQGTLPVLPADAGYVRELFWNAVQRLLTSNVASGRRGQLVELLHMAGGVSGSLEDIMAQAKYQQICAFTAADGNGEPWPKRPRLAPLRRVWADGDVSTGGDRSGLLALEDAFDCDALLSGEAEQACRRFEDYFGLPSQREPAGHVPGPALLASRIGNSAELARLALTSLNNLAERRFLLRDKTHERAVVFAEPRSRKAGNSAADGGEGAAKRKANGRDATDLSIFLSAKPEEASGDDIALGRDPRAPAMRPRDQSAAPPGGSAVTNGKHQRMLLPTVGDAGTSGSGTGSASIRLPSDVAGKDGLQLQIYDEVLESPRRMGASLLRPSLSASQLEAFERLSRQVALHLAAGASPGLKVSPGLQLAMCKAYIARALDLLKATPGSSLALGQLAELFFAKYATDVARCQDSLGMANEPASAAAAKTPLSEVLEGVGAGRTGGFTYADLFNVFLREFDQRELPRRELRVLLGEIPMVPAAAFHMLEAQCRSQDEKPRKVSLMTLLALIESRPSCRWQGIQLLFRLAYGAGEDKSLRFDTIRLIINKIYSAGSQLPMRWQLPHLDDVEALPHLGGAEAVAAAAAAAEAADDPIPLQRLRGRCVEDVATLMLRSMAPNDACFRFPVKASTRVEKLRASLFASGKVCSPEDRMWLYLALCIKRPVLLHGLVETFTRCDEGMQGHLVSSVEEAIKHIPASEPELLMLVQKAKPETERLVLKVLHILMQTSQSKGESLTKAYGEAVTRLYGVTQNPRLLVPVFDLLDRRDLLEFLPAVLQLEKEQVTDAFGQLVRSKSPPLSVTELLTELHHMNKPSENIVPVKFSMQGLNIMFGMREKFDSKVYGIVIQSLVEEPGPLPTLFMRTVIQVVKELPRLSDFIVMEILPRLLRQEVWGDENMWRGFMIVLQHTFTSQPGGAARVLAMLPSSHLEDILVQHPDWKAQLVEFVARQPPGTVPPHVRQLLQ